MTEIELVCEMDEQWFFVGNKENQRWLWYAWSPRFKTVFADAFGRRTDDTLSQLLNWLQPFDFLLFCTDDRGTYQRLLPEEKHLITKKHTEY